MDISALFTNVWSLFLVVLFFGGSIFVHELGHFLAARRRGLKVERFSIGFGPKIVAWRGQDGVEYRLSWLPLGGYVALPQLADMRAIEGESSAAAAALPPPSYATKVIVFAAGAVFNIIFAFVLASVLWGLGQRVAEEEQTTRVGVVLAQIELPNGQTRPGPAFAAGVQPGDRVLSVDGRRVDSFSEIALLVALGSGRGANNEPKVDLRVERDGREIPIVVFPEKLGAEKVRDIGLEPTTRVFIDALTKDGAAAGAGLKPGDELVSIDGRPVTNVAFVPAYLRETAGRPVSVAYMRDGQPGAVQVTPRPMVDPETKTTAYRLGVIQRRAVTEKVIHVAPWVQIERHIVITGRTLISLVSPGSDIGLSKMSGPIGIAERIHTFAQFDFRLVLAFTVLININLAIFNLLPIPVLDGGHILFATIAKLRGRALPPEFIATTQSVFILLLFSMVIYVSFFDVRRIARFRAEENPAATAPPTPAEPAPAAP
jgi:regulator of sigma E protease